MQTFYIDSLWDVSWNFFLPKFPLPQDHTHIFNTFALSDLDETCYIYSFLDVICTFYAEIRPAPEFRPSPRTFSSGFEHFPIVQFR